MKKKKWCLSSLRSPGSKRCVPTGWSRSGSRRGHAPLPGDEVDVVSQRRVVSGHVLGGSVLSRVVGLGRIRLGQRAQAHEQGQGKGQSGEPQSLAPQHLRAPKRHNGGALGVQRTHAPHLPLLPPVPVPPLSPMTGIRAPPSAAEGSGAGEHHPARAAAELHRKLRATSVEVAGRKSRSTTGAEWGDPAQVQTLQKQN